MKQLAENSEINERSGECGNDSEDEYSAAKGMRRTKNRSELRQGLEMRQMIVTTSQPRNVRFQQDEEMPSNGEQSRERERERERELQG